jgi:hypothetical protein
MGGHHFGRQNCQRAAIVSLVVFQLFTHIIGEEEDEDYEKQSNLVFTKE